MKKIKLAKKEYIVIKRDDLDLFLNNISQRLCSIGNQLDIIETLNEEKNRRATFDRARERMEDCYIAVENFRESF